MQNVGYREPLLAHYLVMTSAVMTDSIITYRPALTLRANRTVKNTVRESGKRNDGTSASNLSSGGRLKTKPENNLERK